MFAIMPNAKVRKEREERKKKKTIYDEIKAGEREPEGVQKGWLNLQPEKYNFAALDPEKRKEISKKGAEAIQKLHGEKKTAKQSLEKILTLKVDDEILAAADVPDELIQKLKRDNPNATLYDLMQLVAVGRAVSGNMKAYELVRDTHGDKPIERVEVTENVTTDQDRELMRTIAARLEQAESVQIIDGTYTDSSTDSGV